MAWRERSDLWYGTALVRPNHDSPHADSGGGYVSFFVTGATICVALTALFDALFAQNWKLTSLLKMMCASDYEEEPQDHEFDFLAEGALKNGLALGAIHVFPMEDQRSQ